jgi:hypothetical protein
MQQKLVFSVATTADILRMPYVTNTMSATIRWDERKPDRRSKMFLYTVRCSS